MKKLLILFVLIACLIPFTANATKVTDFTAETSPDTADLLWLTVDVSTTAADRKITLGNLLLWMATQDWTTTGTWDMSSSTVTWPATITTTSFVGALTGNADTATALAANGANCSAGTYPLGVDASGAAESCTNPLDTPTFTLADDSTLTLPSAAVDGGWTTGLLGFGPDGIGIFVNIADLEATIPISGEITDEQVACWESSETPGTNKLKSCGAKTTDNSTASNFIYKDSDGHLENATVTGTGTTMVLATGPTITLGENSTINNGASPTVNAAGEVAVDTTTDQFKYYGSAARVLPYIQYLSFVIPAPAEADDINIMKAPYGMTIIGINCIVQGTTSATGQIQECDSAGANCADLDSDIACDADGAADDGTLTDSTIASGAWVRWKTTSVSDTPTFLTVTVRYSVVAD